MMRTLTILTTALLLSFAFGQSAATFTNAMFDDLWADTVSCTAYGLDERPYDFSRCGTIDDNAVAANKSIIERHVRQAGFVIMIPWKVEWAGSLKNNQLGFGNANTGAAYVVNYLEMGPSNSFVWVIGTW